MKVNRPHEVNPITLRISSMKKKSFLYYIVLRTWLILEQTLF